MTTIFDFTRLKNIYLSTLESFDRFIAFDIRINKGRFLFMMFLSDEDGDAKDMLYVYMRNSRFLQKIKMYGNHEEGTFKVYITDEVKERFIHELQLEKGNGEFDFNNFLAQLNENIPLDITQQTKLNNIRNDRELIGTLGVVDEADKTVLIGVRHLTIGTPQYKTLRKLYLYTDANANDITELIDILRKTNTTLMWTAEENDSRAADINEIINAMRNNE